MGYFCWNGNLSNGLIIIKSKILVETQQRINTAIFDIEWFHLIQCRCFTFITLQATNTMALNQNYGRTLNKHGWIGWTEKRQRSNRCLSNSVQTSALVMERCHLTIFPYYNLHGIETLIVILICVFFFFFPRANFIDSIYLILPTRLDWFQSPVTIYFSNNPVW